MQVTVLGKSPSWEDAGGACSGYLVQEEGFSLLLDCGNGAFSKLRRVIDYVDVDAVVVSHLHADHFFDLVPYSYALSTGPRRDTVRPPLHAPPGASVGFRRVAGCLGAEDLLERAFAVSEYTGDRELSLGPFTVRLCEVPHFVLTHAIELEAAGRRFTFGADCRPNPELARFGRETDVLMLESTLAAPEAHGEPGELARQAGAHRLVLTHYSDELDAEWMHSEASAAFRGPVELAAEGAVYAI
jgi:ribonuclease BN (tRNA processing enzyme)